MSVNLHNDVANHYYSGQGVVMIGQRDSSGNAGALLALGNVSSLKISIANSVIDHKGAQDGQRAIDKRLVTETKGTISFDLENLISKNLAMALRGVNTVIPAGTVTTTADQAYVGATTNLPYVSVSSLVVTQATTGWQVGALTEYVDSVTAWDYKWNPDAGSFHLNSGVEGVAPSKLSILLTGVPVATIAANSVPVTGMTTFPTTAFAVGDYGVFWGVTGAGAATVNGIEGVVTALTASTLTVTVPGAAGVISLSTTTSFTPTRQGTTGLPFPVAVTVAYSYAAQNRADALTTPTQEMFLRFEGLNTADLQAANTSLFSPVVVEVFKFSVDPLKELDLISDTIGKVTIEGAVLADFTKTSGSKFFSVRQTF